MKHNFSLFAGIFAVAFICVFAYGCSAKPNPSPTPQSIDGEEAARAFSKQFGHDMPYSLDPNWNALDNGDDFRMDFGVDVGLPKYQSSDIDQRYFATLFDSDGISIISTVIIRAGEPVTAYIDAQKDGIIVYGKMSDTVDNLRATLEEIYAEQSGVHGMLTPDPGNPEYMTPEEQAEYNEQMIREQIGQEIMDDIE